MTQKLQEEMDSIREIAHKGDKDAAMLMANNLLQRYPSEARVWFLRSYLYARERKYKESIDDITKSIDISPESRFFFERGNKYYQIGQYDLAIDDFSTALNLDNYGDESYKEVLFFCRAETFIKLGKKQEAFSDLSGVKKLEKWYTSGLRTKADLLADINRL